MTIGTHTRYSRSSGWPGGGRDGNEYSHWVIGCRGQEQLVALTSRPVAELCAAIVNAFDDADRGHLTGFKWADRGRLPPSYLEYRIGRALENFNSDHVGLVNERRRLERVAGVANYSREVIGSMVVEYLTDIEIVRLDHTPQTGGFISLRRQGAELDSWEATARLALDE